MMDGASIRRMSQDAASKAAREHKTPYIWEQDDFEEPERVHFPFIGTYVPRGWVMVNTYFVDSSGFGDEGEPALTREQFLKKLQVGRGYAIIEAGQFQVYIGEFVQAPRRPKAKKE
jgi:hypothetical protein